MVLIEPMRHADNDNEELSFITLSAATKNVTRYLATKDHPSGGKDRPANDKSEKTPDNQPDAHRKYVDHRLRELAAFERKVSGEKM